MSAVRPLAAVAPLAALALAGTMLGGCARRPADPAAAPQADDMSLGAPSAKVSVIEYASASCPHCAQWNAEVFPIFRAKYVDTGKVRYTLREYLTDPQAIAAAGFLLARCAGKDRYFPVLDAVFKGQEEMVATNDVRGVLLKVAQGPGGLTEDQFNACMRDTAAEQALSARVDRHEHVDKVDSTPTFIINGKRTEGEMTLPELDAAIAQAAG
ncbi:MAG TPA: DsbA family protein [Phenylobacterium sp.]|jgi:protein-disulfide isomerase|uniref:DsbA family protein n=1 Tax=Phenylobacterium sp. TaxID=1871053 RepID=UPI002D244E75|nr:DsbA family protein [Phenylobacterium sp.]HZZ68375.1 DsbA family protein [Phenylobacterium sp.]